MAKSQEDQSYEKWKRDNDLDGRGFPHAPVLPSESVAARIANGGRIPDGFDAEEDEDA